MEKKLKILFVPVDGMGHFYASIGIAALLRDRGHSVTFAALSNWKGKLEAMGFAEELYTNSNKSVDNAEQAGEIWGELMAKVAPIIARPSIEIHEGFYFPMLSEVNKQIMYVNEQLKTIVDRVKPDVLVLDMFHHVPALMDAGIPWILLTSVTPLGITSHPNVPPAYSGYATTGDPKEYKDWYDVVENVYGNMVKKYNEWLLQNGSRQFKYRFPYLMDSSPYANIYMYPQELDYTPFRPNPPKTYQFDSFVRPSTENFEIPAQIQPGPGKLIYFSMGTLGCFMVDMMRRLIGILTKSPHRFIVSKGPRGDNLELGPNMWGANHVPQVSVIPVVDLVITHGGNNTITESFYFGKRVLVLPLLFDQLDNAQRVFETGLGLQFHPLKVTEVELLNGIELLLNDDLLEQRMISISQRIHASNSQTRAADLVENTASEHIKIS